MGVGAAQAYEGCFRMWPIWCLAGAGRNRESGSADEDPSDWGMRGWGVVSAAFSGCVSAFVCDVSAVCFGAGMWGLVAVRGAVLRDVQGVSYPGLDGYSLH